MARALTIALLVIIGWRQMFPAQARLVEFCGIMKYSRYQYHYLRGVNLDCYDAMRQAACRASPRIARQASYYGGKCVTGVRGDNIITDAP